MVVKYTLGIIPLVGVELFDFKNPPTVDLVIGQAQILARPRFIVTAVTVYIDRDTQPEVQSVDDTFDLRDLLSELVCQTV